MKFGLGRATYDSAQEIHNGDITRDEAMALIRRYDGGTTSMLHCLDYMDITEQQFDVIDEGANTSSLSGGNDWKIASSRFGSLRKSEHW